jgi:hypothetical protein
MRSALACHSMITVALKRKTTKTPPGRASEVVAR